MCDARGNACVPGRSTACTCPDGAPSVAVCDATERVGPCRCEGDGGLPDAPDAGPAACNPYAGDTCGCGEPIPPLTPTLDPIPGPRTLGTGPETLVDVLVGPEGIFVVLRDEIRLLSRAGEPLAAWHNRIEITAALRVGARLVAVDRARVTWLEADLRERGQFAPVEPCLHPLAASCDRLLCAQPGLVEWTRHTYELATGRDLFDGTLSQASGTPAATVPGVDAFLTAPYGYSPSNFWYHRVQADGTLELVTDAPYWGEYDASPVFAFVGWPATQIVTQTGLPLRLDSCFTASADDRGTCLRLSRRLVGFGDDDTLAMDGGRDGVITSVRARRHASPFESPCIAGCRIERIDALSQESVSSRPISFRGGGYEVRVRNDPWSGRAVVSTPLSCEPDYPNHCEGWEVRLEAP